MLIESEAALLRKDLTTDIDMNMITLAGRKKKLIGLGEAVSGPFRKSDGGGDFMSVSEIFSLLTLIATVALVIVTAMKR